MADDYVVWVSWLSDNGEATGMCLYCDCGWTHNLWTDLTARALTRLAMEHEDQHHSAADRST